MKDRMKHIAEWEDSRGKLWNGPEVDRSQILVPAAVFDCRICGKICKSKAGMVNHKRRMHEESDVKKKFECGECKGVFKKASDLKNHSKVCGGAVAEVAGNVRCICGLEMGKSSFKSHRKDCLTWQNAHPPEVAAAARAAPRGPCDVCGTWMRKDNVARHKRTACPGGEAGP